MDFLKHFDGSGRKPRQVQTQFLTELANKWDQSNVFVGILPTGAGKSAIAKSIQKATGADIVCPSVILQEQYAGDYPEGNSLKGKARYKCQFGFDCHTWQSMCEIPCETCPYMTARNAAIAGAPTTFNPLSLYYLQLSAQVSGAGVIVVDEAHTLSNMMLLMASKRFRQSEYKFTSACKSEVVLVEWLETHIQRLGKVGDLYYRQKDFEKLARTKQEMESLALVRDGLAENGQNYVIDFERDKKDTYMNVRPLFPPALLMDRLLGDKKVVLLSGTLFDYHIKELVGDKPYVKIECESPIPKENRPIAYRSAPFKINYQTEPGKIAGLIESYVTPGVNTIIHTTYSLARKLAPLMTCKPLINTAEDKDEVLAEFKKRGGVFLASGCAEGIDLKGDLCRLNLIPKIPFADLSDPAVQRRKALPDGDRWFMLDALLKVIQMAGRSTRAPDDHSMTVVLDPNFKRLVNQNREYLPKYFLESLDF